MINLNKESEQSYCEKCGKAIPSDASYCPYCGEQLLNVIDIKPFFIAEDTFVVEGRGIVVIGYLNFGKISCGDLVHIVHRDQHIINNGVVKGIEIGGKLYDNAVSGETYGFLIRSASLDIKIGDFIYL